jgi:DNA repair exonuclease SbcCD nuclease subunit
MPLQYIFHLSDLHIRNGNNVNSRFNEYFSVFNNTIISINDNIKKYNLSFDDFIIIITGDIFHNRYNINNYGLLLFNHLILSLTNIGKVILFEGNHERLIDNNPSLINSFNFNINNLTILDKSISFIIDNIGFSYLSLYDTMNIDSLTGRKELLPSFPVIKENVKYKIALFHGSFASAKLYNGDEIINNNNYNPYPLEWVQDFDYVLLGDIHKRQIFNYKKKTLCGYSGSLIQQNFGENIIDHGYLLWNLQTKNIKEINVKNNIGYINIKQNDKGDILIRKNGKYECLLEQEIKDNIDYFPKLIEIKTFSKINFQNLNNLLNSYDINFTIISNLNERCLNLDITNDYNIDNSLNDKHEIDNIIDNNYILSYFSKMLSIDKQNKLTNIIKNKELLLFDVNKYPDDLTDECIRRNKDIILSITNCVKTDDIKELKQPFTIKYLEWEGLLCYENKNWVNMEDLDAKTFMIKGKNGTGKTAIYNILLIAIWGKINKEIKTLTSIINCKKTSGYTIVDIEINNVMYRIKRDYIIKDKKEVLNHINLYKYINDNELVLESIDTNATKKIDLLFGNITCFLSSSMITQKVDNDILKFDVKKTLETIDKAFNIDYIYNLYNLFKISINKYKDFKRLIESKKQVYEKLVSNCKIEIIDDIEMQKLNDELILKTKERDEILLLFDDIKIDIKNPKNLIILETDYLSLINLLDKSKIIDNCDELDLLKQRYNELKFILKDEKDLFILKNAYNTDIENYFKINKQFIKPCELSILENEKKQLNKYFDTYNKNKDDVNLNVLIESLNLLKDKELGILEEKNKELIENKPNKIIKSSINKDDLLKEINNIYTNIDIFNEFILTLNISRSLNNIKSSLNYDDYKLLLKQKIKLENVIDINKIKLAKLESDFNNIFKKQQNTILKNKPLNQLKDTKLKTSTSINKEIKLIKINDILKQIEIDEDIIKTQTIIFNKINDLEKQLDIYKNELFSLTTNEEYEYNPKCKYCCKRPWVCRIKELGININKINEELINFKSLLTITDLNKLIDTNENNKLIKNYYYLLNEWFDYYKSKEQYDKITKELNIIINDKTDTNKLINLTNEEINKINIDIDNFNIYSYSLYEQFINIEKYEKYRLWENDYNDVIINITKLKLKIKELEDEIDYNKNIKPRINKYYELNDLYNKWLEYDYNTKILNTNELFKLKDILDTTDKYIDYNNNNNNKPLIKKKLELNEQLKIKERDIKILNDKIIKLTTINTYNNDNKDNYNKLFDIIIDLDITIDMLETVIVNFQAFKIELYDKFILNKLIDKTNKIIKSLCHKDTKPFKLDYILDVSKDYININWLINNENISLHSNKDVKQIISVCQASGFQHFVISLALRISLFMNKYDIQCSQLFIDEGFVNFDKYNLSIVPSFLKSLLSYFKSVTIVSHIDLIQDNVDEIIEIDYDKISSVSNMQYGIYKNTIVKRTRK